MLEPHSQPGHCPWKLSDGMPYIYSAHSHQIIHVRPTSQTNILVDKDGTPRIASLESAYILPHPTALVVEDSKAVTDRIFRSLAPEFSGPGLSSDTADHTHSTKASDMYAFGVMAFEVRTGSFVWYSLGSLTRDRFSPGDLRFSRCPRLQRRTRC